jgi:hypothetical protein
MSCLSELSHVDFEECISHYSKSIKDIYAMEFKIFFEDLSLFVFFIFFVIYN